MARASTGTMRQRKPGIWELAVSVQKSQAVIDSVQRFSAVADWLSGESPKPKQQRRYETFQGTKAEAEARLREMQVGADRGDLPRSNITVGEWLAHWLKNYVAEQLAANTLRTYTWLVDQHIGPRIGSAKLDTVRAVDVEALLSDVRKEVPGSGQLAYQALNGAFERAVKMDLLRDNPVRKADKPKAVADKEIIPPRRAQVESFLEASAGHPYHALYFTLASTGLRIGEALGLRWDNVQLRETGSILHVREQQINAGDGMKLAGLKTKASRRAIPLTGETVKVLAAHYVATAALRDSPNDVGLVFPHPKTGGFLQPAEVRRHLEGLWAKAGAPRFKIHAFRHYFASEALRRGVDLARVSRLMGHSSIAITSKLYIHLEIDDLADAMAIFEAGGKPNSGPIAVADMEKLLVGVAMGDDC